MRAARRDVPDVPDREGNSYERRAKKETGSTFVNLRQPQGKWRKKDVLA